ncbi:hypothetical protein NC661_19820 [Aquibacillus koreensis]|uniref:Uncharacterized protein n=1 Tax=Aquibacillus koreensis TaxID=279446 RepID=A0A9X4AK87_9BACI|nr:hypothetical protein [Aquibacillus koreensis]MCT2536650.1 hypothetical protein [Aquibacillus koreensis]MDC3422604.1 hypothetical protein [Aquibacillus koreensis]
MDGLRVNKKTETNIKLPLSFIFFGLVAFVVAQFIFLMNSGALTSGAFRIPEVLMGAHFLLLGWVVMVIMGAMYQLVPVAFLTPIWSEKLGFIQFVITAVGIIVFSVLLGWKINLTVYGAIILIIGILLFLFQMIMTLKKQEEKTILTSFVMAALLCFLITISAGLVLAASIAFGTSFNYSAILHSHILLGVAGWFTLLIFGFSYKLVPMFSLSHGFSMKGSGVAFVSYILGLAVLLVSFWTDFGALASVGWGLLWVGFTCFCLDIREILNKRLKKGLDRPFVFSLLAIGYGWLIHTAIVILRMFGVQDEHVWSWLIFLYIVCWVMFSILGYLYKIVPFLWWTFKYSNQVGKANVPLLKDMINEKLGVILFGVFTVGTLGLAIFGIPQLSFAVTFFLVVMLIASIGYFVSIVLVVKK